MNRFERAPLLPGEAVVQYLDGDMKVMRPGHFVRCAVTGASIALEELRYCLRHARSRSPIDRRDHARSILISSAAAPR